MASYFVYVLSGSVSRYLGFIFTIFGGASKVLVFLNSTCPSIQVNISSKLLMSSKSIYLIMLALSLILKSSK